MSQVVKFKKLHPQATLPKYQTKFASGFDFHALVVEEDGASIKVPVRQENGSFIMSPPSLIINPKMQAIIRTGLAMVLPEGYEMQIRPRSSWAMKNMLTITNSPGTIDQDFRGEIMVILINHGYEPMRIEHGVRIAQGVVQQVEQYEIVEIADFSEEDISIDRGGGLGSTGIK